MPDTERGGETPDLKGYDFKKYAQNVVKEYGNGNPIPEMTGESHEKDLLLVIDMQNDFSCVGKDDLCAKSGTFAVGQAYSANPEYAQEVRETVINLISNKKWKNILASKDFHPADHISFKPSERDPPRRENPEGNETYFPAHCTQTDGKQSYGARFVGNIKQALQNANDNREGDDDDYVKVFFKGFNKNIDSFGAARYNKAKTREDRLHQKVFKTDKDEHGNKYRSLRRPCSNTYTGAYRFPLSDPKDIDSDPANWNVKKYEKNTACKVLKTKDDDGTEVPVQRMMHEVRFQDAEKKTPHTGDVYVCGLALDFCVMDTAINIKRLLSKEGHKERKVYIVLDATRPAFIYSGEDGKSERDMVKKLKHEGVELVFYDDPKNLPEHKEIKVKVDTPPIQAEEPLTTQIDLKKESSDQAEAKVILEDLNPFTDINAKNAAQYPELMARLIVKSTIATVLYPDDKQIQEQRAFVKSKYDEFVESLIPSVSQPQQKTGIFAKVNQLKNRLQNTNKITNKNHKKIVQEANDAISRILKMVNAKPNKNPITEESVTAAKEIIKSEDQNKPTTISKEENKTALSEIKDTKPPKLPFLAFFRFAPIDMYRMLYEILSKSFILIKMANPDALNADELSEEDKSFYLRMKQKHNKIIDEFRTFRSLVKEGDEFADKTWIKNSNFMMKTVIGYLNEMNLIAQFMDIDVSNKETFFNAKQKAGESLLELGYADSVETTEMQDIHHNMTEPDRLDFALNLKLPEMAKSIIIMDGTMKDELKDPAQEDVIDMYVYCCLLYSLYSLKSSRESSEEVNKWYTQNYVDHLILSFDKSHDKAKTVLFQQRQKLPKTDIEIEDKKQAILDFQAYVLFPMLSGQGVDELWNTGKWSNKMDPNFKERYDKTISGLKENVRNSKKIISLQKGLSYSDLERPAENETTVELNLEHLSEEDGDIANIVNAVTTKYNSARTDETLFKFLQSIAINNRNEKDGKKIPKSDKRMQTGSLYDPDRESTPAPKNVIYYSPHIDVPGDSYIWTEISYDKEDGTTTVKDKKMSKEKHQIISQTVNVLKTVKDDDHVPSMITNAKHFNQEQMNKIINEDIKTKPGWEDVDFTITYKKSVQMSRITNLRQIIDNLTARNKLDSTKKYTIEEPWTMPSIDGKFQYIVLATEPQLVPETNTWSWKEILRNSSLERLYLRNINNGKIETVHEFPLNSKVIVDQLGIKTTIPDFNEIISYTDEDDVYTIKYVDINSDIQTHIIPKEDAEEPAEDTEEGTEEADTASIATDLSTLDDEEEEELDPAEAARIAAEEEEAARIAAEEEAARLAEEEEAARLAAEEEAARIAAEEEAALIAAKQPSDSQAELIRLVCSRVRKAMMVLEYEDENEVDEVEEDELKTVKDAANNFLTNVGDLIQKSSDYDDSETEINKLAADFDAVLEDVKEIVFSAQTITGEELKSKLDEITGLDVPIESICVDGEDDLPEDDLSEDDLPEDDSDGLDDIPDVQEDIPSEIQAEYDALTEEVNEEKETEQQVMQEQEVEEVEKDDEIPSDSKALLDKIASNPHYKTEATVDNLKNWGFNKGTKLTTIKRLHKNLTDEDKINKLKTFYQNFKKEVQEHVGHDITAAVFKGYLFGRDETDETDGQQNKPYFVYMYSIDGETKIKKYARKGLQRAVGLYILNQEGISTSTATRIISITQAAAEDGAEDGPLKVMVRYANDNDKEDTLEYTMKTAEEVEEPEGGPEGEEEEEEGTSGGNRPSDKLGAAGFLLGITLFASTMMGFSR
nr:hypothetical protein TetV2_00330 [Oceanusvirus sp.]